MPPKSVVETYARLRSVAGETRARRPFHQHPSPVAAVSSSSVPGKYGRAHLHPAVDLQAEQHAVERHAAQERFGPVDRVDEPAVTRPGGARPGAFADAELFPDDGVIGVCLLDPTADELFRQAVGDCDRRVIGLEIGPHACAEVAQREPSGEVGGLCGELHVFA